MSFDFGIKSESFKYREGFDKGLFDIKSISLRCTVNSFAAFQLFMKNDESFTLSMTDSPTFTIYPKRQLIRIHAAIDGLGAFTVANISCMEDDKGRLYADCLENSDYIHSEAGKIVSLWCEKEVGRDISPGIYNGSISIYARRLFESEELMETLGFSLEVIDISLPDPKDYSFHLDLWQHLSNLSRKHDVRLFSNEHFEVIEKYVVSLSRLGQKAVTVIATDIPWSGQRTFNDLGEPTDLFEYSYINTQMDEKGDFIYDYSVMDRYIEMCFKYGIDKKIEVFGLCGIWMTEENGFGKAARDFPDGVRIRYYDRTSGTFAYMDKSSQIGNFMKSLYEHFIKKGWLEKVRITADEPHDIEVYRKTIEAILKEGPGFKFSISINKAEFTTEFNDIMSDVTPSLKCLAEDFDFIRENLIPQKDKTVSWYVCCRPHYPNTFLKSHLLESRFICMLTSLLELDGFLRWNYTVWPEKPREGITFRSPEWPAGDMNFVYPGSNGSPLLTLRYKSLLRGIEDFELMKMAKEAGHLVNDEIYLKLLGVTTLRQLSDAGYDESEPEKPFSLDEKDYSEIRSFLYKLLLLM